MNNIVKSKKWANRKNENGLDGGVAGQKLSKEHKLKISRNNANFWKGKKRSEESKEKMRKPKSEEHKQKMSESRKGKQASKQTKQKMSESKKGTKLSEETKQKLRRYNNRKGVKHSKETKLKISNSMKGKIQKKIKCPHCDKFGRECLMKRWHFDNCKLILVNR